MGAKDSKRSCLPYEDAVKRMSDEEYKRICEAFKRLSGGNSLLSKQIFIQYVLGDCVPTTIAECLYQACGGTVRGITLKDLICGLVLLTKGKQDEKIRFLWTLYSNDNGQYIQRNEFYQSLEMEGVLLDKKQNLNRLMLSLFPIGQDRINFEQFNLWIQYNYDATILSKWLLTPVQSSISTTNVSLSCIEIETPTFYQTLSGVTHLDEHDISELEKCFWTLQSQSITGHLDINFIRTMICPPIPIKLYDGLFNALDVNHDGHIDFKELCCGISAACRGPLAERMKFCFKLFDLDRDLYLNQNEFKHMIDTLLFIINDNQQQLQQEEVIMESLKKRLDSNNGLSQEEFLVWSIEENYLIEPLLELLFQVCHISFVLKPNCRHHEYDIVIGWLEREERHGYHIGQFWYLISIKWWQQWLNYTTLPYNQNYDQCHCFNNNNHTNTNNSSSNNSLKNHNIEDGIVCDESLISNSTDYTTNSSNEFNSNSMESMGDLLSNKGDSCSIASSSGVSSSSGTTNLKQRHYINQQQHQHQLLLPPGPIDNKNLIEETTNLTNFNTKIQTLTGEGGRLKRNTPLVQNRDFILIPDILWKALAHWYGGPLPLPRQVILPPGSQDVELELYPINLNIYKHQSINVQQQQQQTWSSVVGGYGAAALNTAGLTTSQITTTTTNQIPKRFLAYTAAFSRLANIRQVSEFLCQRLQLRYEDIRLWHIKDNNNQTIFLEDENLTLQDLNIVDNDKILLEIRNKDLTWPEELNALVVNNNNNNTNNSNNNSLSVINNTTTSLERRPTICLPPGATGLHNLGNTCFMNAALQAVSNTRPLTLYFQQDGQLIELNSINPLGTKGMVAKRYAELCRELWTGSTRSVAPLKLRYCVTKHAPHLGGGGQHDSQELLAWLLDALHEDLNRVAKKQYIELKDSAGRPDEIVADEAWSLHLSRDHSIITDLFYGQLKSKVTCQTCGHESVRFDPFNLLSLPLPMESYTLCEVLVVRLSGDIPIKYGLRLNSDAKYLELKQQLSKLCNIDTKYLLLAEIEYSQIRTIINDNLRINPITATELYAYELPEFYQNDNCNLQEQQEEELQQQQQQQESDLDIAVPDSPLARSPEVRGGSALCMPNILCFKTKERNYSGCINDSNSSSHNNNNNNNIIKSSILRKQPIRKYNDYNDDDDDDDEFSDDNSIDKKKLNDNNIDGGNNGVAAAINNNNNSNNNIDDINNFPQYLLAVHRKSVRQEIYFLSQQKQKPSLFGMPLLLGCCKTSTCQSLYEEVLNQITRLLSPLPQSDQTNHATDCDDSLGYEFPFTLKMVLQGGQICAICHWTQFCRGCTLPCTDELLIDKFKGKQNIINIAIDWDPTALHLRYQSNREKLWIDDESVGYYRKLHTEPIDLDYCLRAFTSEERLEAKYHCSNCQDKQPATKKLQIWRLPPILIIHLKRFDYVNNKWVKTQKVVNFPFKNFDPTEYLASVPQETILRHHQLKQQKQQEQEQLVQEQHELNDIIDENCEQQQQQTRVVNDEKEQLLENNPKLQKTNQRQQRRNRLESTSLLKTPIIDEHLKDYHQHKLLPGQDPFDLKYQLYAVVSHSGMLNGGHYISYACNPNGHWYCYNDSSCREVLTQELPTEKNENDSITTRITGTNDCVATTTTEQQPKCVYSDVKIPKIDTSTAYILFYERSGLDYKPYLPDIVANNNNSNNDVNNLNNSQIVPDLDMDENESELRKQLCVLQ